jgi:hypothetical protein
MKPLRARLGEPVGERLDHDGVVVVVVPLVGARQRLGADPARDRECTEVVGLAASEGRHEVGQ